MAERRAGLRRPRPGLRPPPAGGRGALGGAPPLALAPGRPELSESDRLNIIQHGGGGPVRFAIRNNFYVGKGTTDHHIHYVTDTEAGASGSPVLDDTWQVVAMHHAHQEVKGKTFKGEDIQYHNQGVLLHSILGHLPGEVRREIETARGGTL